MRRSAPLAPDGVRCTAHLRARNQLVARHPVERLEGPACRRSRRAQATVAALDAIRGGAADNESVFGLRISQIKVRIKAAAKAAGLEGVSSHGCRIGMAQDLARSKGIEMPAIMQAGGWRSETTVARYTARESAARGAVARFYEQEAEQ